MQGTLNDQLSDELAVACYEMPARRASTGRSTTPSICQALTQDPRDVGLLVGYTARDGWLLLPLQSGTPQVDATCSLPGNLHLSSDVQPPRPSVRPQPCVARPRTTVFSRPQSRHDQRLRRHRQDLSRRCLCRTLCLALARWRAHNQLRQLHSQYAADIFAVACSKSYSERRQYGNGPMPYWATDSKNTRIRLAHATGMVCSSSMTMKA